VEGMIEKFSSDNGIPLIEMDPDGLEDARR